MEPPTSSLSIPAATRASAKPSTAVRASYQGNEYAGRWTASGEPYDPDALTAASRTLPIGSSVMVTNPATGGSVKVRINDRGGSGVHGRGLDLSMRAAEEIGMTKKGVARVRVKRVDFENGWERISQPPCRLILYLDSEIMINAGRGRRDWKMNLVKQNENSTFPRGAEEIDCAACIRRSLS